MLLSLLSLVLAYNCNAGVIMTANIPTNKFIFSKAEVSALKQKLNISTDDLLVALLPAAKKNARPPISNYYVGAVGLTKSGRILFGNNLEFKGTPINQTVHAEQFLTILALLENEQLVTIAVSAEPCGHCRQFLNEIKGASRSLKILVPGKAPKYLGSLLPDSFGPDNLNMKDSIYTVRDNKLKLDRSTDDKTVLTALKNANISYSPYSNSYSGVAIKMNDGSIYGGFYVENAAFNPAIQPLTAAIIRLVSEGREYGNMKEVVLVEKKGASIEQADISEAVIKAVAPDARFKVFYVKGS
jgi:cytidine deaminase